MTEHVTPDGVYNDQGIRIDTADHLIVNGEQWRLMGIASALKERAAVAKQLDNARETIRRQNEQYVALQTSVHEVIAELVDDCDLDRDAANRVLDELRLDRLDTEYEWTISVTLTGTAESTMDEEDFRDWIVAHVGIEATAWPDGQVSAFSQDSCDVEEVKVEKV